MVGGVIAYRWDTNMVGQLVVQNPLFQNGEIFYARYVPSTIEFLAAGGIIAFGLMVFTLGVRYLKVVDHSPQVSLH